MFRKLAGLAALGLLFCAAAAMAADVKGKVTKVDETNSKITLTVDGKDTEYTVHKDCKWPKVKGKDGTEKEMDLKGLAKMVERAKDKDKGRSVEITAKLEKKDGKEVVTEIKQESGGKKKDKKDDKKEDKKDGQ